MIGSSKMYVCKKWLLNNPVNDIASVW
jgi:hypothetical protein